MIEKSWSGMRKYLEREMTAESLRGRIQYMCTHYQGMEEFRVFEICVDKKIVKRFSWETVNSYFIREKYTEDESQKNRCNALPFYWYGFHKMLNHCPMSERTEYVDEEFSDALAAYRNQEITKSIQSDNPLIRMFAILDRRVGKRTLMKLKDSVEQHPEWLQFFYRLRMESEGIRA